MDAKIEKPTKEQIRAWLRERQARPAPLPSFQQIRDELGWKLIGLQRPAPADVKDSVC